MDSVSLATAPARGAGLADAIAHALGREAPNEGERAPGGETPALSLIRSREHPPVPARGSPQNASRGRRKVWQLPPIYHCSLLGTCLGLDEMRRLASRLGLSTSARVSDYELHHQLVHLAASGEREGRRLDRYLEEKFARALRAFREHRDEAALREGWDRALRADDDLGASYFALLTHPALGKELAQEAMGHVHMLSHVATSAIRRVRAELERARARIAKQEVALGRERRGRERQGERVRALRERLAARERASQDSREPDSVPSEATPTATPSATPGVDRDALLRELRSRLEKSEHERRAWRRLYRRARRHVEALESDAPPLTVIDTSKLSVSSMGESRTPDPEADPGPPSCDLAGRVVAYVGGRGRVVPRLRALTERCNGRFVYHDGGLQERAGRIDESLAGSDIVVVPLDCVSHDASRRLKRRCRQQGKTILWLRTASVSAFEGALRQAMQARAGEAKRECVLPS